MRYFPVFLDLNGRIVLVLGGGAVAANKLRLFAKTGARLRCVAQAFNEEIARLVASGRVEGEIGDPAQAEFGNAFVVIAATGSEADVTIATRARAAGILVNAVDRTEYCTFITPSIVDRGKVAVAIGTEGSAPVLARRIREQVEILLPDRLGALADFIGGNRERAGEVFSQTPERRAFWETVVDGEIGALVLQGRTTEAGDKLTQLFSTSTAASGQPRATLLISPKDAGDLTLRGLRALQDADVVVCAAEVPASILDKARRDAERVVLGGEIQEGGGIANEFFRNFAGRHGRFTCVFRPEEDVESLRALSLLLRDAKFSVEICNRVVDIESG